MAERAHTEVIVLGAGPAGLAVGACLATRGVTFTIIESATTVGSRWREHYRRLHLHTAKQWSSLPMVPWPTETSNYPSREEMVRYLEGYAARFGLAPRFGHTAVDVHRDGDFWVVATREGETFRAKSVVIATGYNRLPNVPVIQGREGFTGRVMHSAEYRDGESYRGSRALVVGAGNSGAEIALDLWESGATTALSVRSAQHVLPRDVLGVPAQWSAVYVLSRLPLKIADRLALSVADKTVGNLGRYGLSRPTEGPITRLTQGHVPLMDLGTAGLIKQKQILIFPGIARFTDDRVVFTDGRAERFDVVVLATGYRASLHEILRETAGLVDHRGLPTVFGRQSAPGLYFVGYRNPVTGQLRDIAIEALRVAEDLTRR